MKTTSRGAEVVCRCRMCKSEYSDCHTPDGHASLALAAMGININPKLAEDPLSPQMFAIHNCSEHRQGLADLIGVSYDLTPKGK